MRRLSKHAQQTTGMPFGMIFSLFLIVVFIVLAFIVIRYVLTWGDCGTIGQFYENLQEKVDNAKKSQSSDDDFEIDLPSGIKKICFSNLSKDSRGEESDIYYEIERYKYYEANLFLLPAEKACDMPYYFVKYLDLEKITHDKNPYCVPTSEKLRIKKDFDDKYVFIEEE